MSTSRSRVLASIRNSLAAARRLPVAPTTRLPPPAAASPALDDLAQQFGDELGQLGGVLIRERAEKVPALVVDLARERQAEGILSWQAESLPVPGLPDHLRREGFRLPGPEIPAGGPSRPERLAQVESISLGLTGAEAALADTGTLVLRSGPGQPRLASLAVRTHIALFTPPQLYASWAAWWAVMEDVEGWVAAASNVILISGPSRTADIEMTLTVGVHGPAEVIAVLVTG